MSISKILTFLTIILILLDIKDTPFNSIQVLYSKLICGITLALVYTIDTARFGIVYHTRTFFQYLCGTK